MAEGNGGRAEVIFHPLAAREDRGEWIVGRVDTGTYVALPPEGAMAVRLLQSGLSLAQTARHIERETGKRIAVEQFIGSLSTLGFVRSVQGRALDSPPLPRPTLPRVRAEHVRWMMHPFLHVAMAVVVLSGACLMVLKPSLRPRWADVLWSDHGTTVLAGQAVLTWVLIVAHELAHLFTARAAGVPGTIRLGTRLHLLVVQTDVSGVWHCERRTRFTVYLSGLGLDLTLVGGCVLAQVATGPSRFLGLVVLTKLLAVAAEFMVFTRTDVYFLLQDLLSCRNLYGDACAYWRHLLARWCPSRRRLSPIAGLGTRERYSVRCYAAVMAVGSAGALVLAYLALTRVVLVLLTRAVHTLGGAPGPLAVADSLTTIVILAGVQSLWATAWWRRHGPKVRAGLPRLGRALNWRGMIRLDRKRGAEAD